MKPIGPTIKRYMEENNIRQKDLADKLGKPQSQISDLLKRPSIDAEKLELLCRTLNISPMTFFELGEDEGSVVIYQDIKGVTASSHFGNPAVHLGAKDTDKSSRENERLLMEKDKRLEEKNRLIEEKERTIQILMRQLGLHNAPDSRQDQ